jgi:hypothetical protein
MLLWDVLEPFQHLGRQRAGRVGGHGLGLAIVQSITRAHGARLAAAARPDGGLGIEIVFPEPPRAARAARAQPAGGPDQARNRGTAVPVRRAPASDNRTRDPSGR